MGTLSITKTYSDNAVLEAADLDNIINAVETLLNTTGLNDDNIQSDGITAASKIKPASITTAKIADNAVTTAKIADDSITTTLINDLAVTTAKLGDEVIKKEKFANAVGVATIGSTSLFHTFNGTVSIPRGWMQCDGSLVNEANYDSQHITGAYDNDGISASALLGKYLPDMNNIYPVGATSTTETGSSAIGTIGQTAHEISIAHSHTATSHTHTVSTAAGESGAFRNGTAGASTGSANTTTTGTSGSASQSIQPESIEFVYIMKVI